MTTDEYTTAALRTARLDGSMGNGDLLLEAVLGINGEAGEIADYYKKTQYQGHRFEAQHMASELGDVLWYIAEAAYALGYTLDEIAQMNIDKLNRRYPEGFDEERSLHRLEGDI